MKTQIRKTIRVLTLNPVFWKLVSICNHVVYRFIFEKQQIEREKIAALQKQKEARLSELFSDLIVRSGVFKGMKYPELKAYGTSIYSKLLGSYESELTPVFKKIIGDTEYSEIIDIGCAEGFYAVGLALKMPWTNVYAYDIEPTALEACKKMADLNGVGGRMHLGEFCSASTLRDFKFSQKGLIISDCEGYEIELFTAENIAKLVNCDILIELHDAISERISHRLFELFHATHDKLIIQSVNCFSKASAYSELSGLTIDEVEICLRERSGIMQWVFFTAKRPLPRETAISGKSQSSI